MPKVIDISPNGQPIVLDEATGNKYIASGNSLTPYEELQQAILNNDPRALTTPINALPPDVALPPQQTPKQPQQQVMQQFTAPQEEGKTTIASGEQINPFTQQALISAIGQEERGDKTLLEAEQKKATKQSQLMEESLQNAQQIQQNYDDKLKLSAQKVQERLDDLSLSIDNLANKETYDPNRLFSNASTETRLLAGISITFGAIGQALGAGENTGLKIINDAINRDIEAQKQEFAKAKDLVSAKNTLYGAYREKYNDDTAAKAAAEASLWALAEKKMQAAALSTKNQEALAQFELAKAKIKEKQAEAQINFEKAISDKVVQEVARKPKSPKEYLDGVKTIQETINSDKDLQDYFSTKRGFDEIKAFLGSGAAGIAQITFIAKAMQQGSFGKEMENIARNIGTQAKLESYLQEALGRGQDSPFFKSILSGLSAKLANQEQVLAPKIQQIQSSARLIGADPEAFVPTGKNSLSFVSRKDKRIK